MAAMSIDEFLSDPVVRWTVQRLEYRYNKNHDKLGRFAHSPGSGGTGAGLYKLDNVPPEVAARIQLTTEGLLMQYPAARNSLGGVKTGPVEGLNTVGQTDGAWPHAGKDFITIDAGYASKPDVLAQKYYEHSGFHPPAGRGDDVVGAVVTHEFGHVLDDMTDHNARVAAEDVLQADWSKKGGYQTGSFSDYLKTNLSGYSVHANNPDHYALLNPAEAIAESFQDVQMNGTAKAKPGSRLLHKLLTDEYKAQYS